MTKAASTGDDRDADEAMCACPDCGGSGVDCMDESMYCPLCGGDGKVTMATAESIDLSYKSWAVDHIPRST